MLQTAQLTVVRKPGGGDDPAQISERANF